MSITLRDITEDDLEQLYHWYSDPALFEYLVGEYLERRAEDAISYMRDHWIGSADTLRKMIVVEGQAIGLAALSAINKTDKTAVIDMFIAQADRRGLGYGKAALELLLKEGFEDLGLSRINLEVLQDNRAAQALYRSCGFQQCGETDGVLNETDGVLKMSLGRGEFLS